MLCNSIILYICAVVNTTMILHIKEKAFSWFLCQRKVEIIYTHIEQTIRLTVYAVGVSCLCVRASTPSLADRQMLTAFFMLIRQHWTGAVKNSFNLKGKSNRVDVDTGRLRSRKRNINMLLLAFDKRRRTNKTKYQWDTYPAFYITKYQSLSIMNERLLTGFLLVYW